MRTCVRDRYHELALELHPDRNEGDNSKTEEFKQLSLAYSYLDKNINELRMDEEDSVIIEEPFNVTEISIEVEEKSQDTTAFSSNWWERMG